MTIHSLRNMIITINTLDTDLMRRRAQDGTTPVLYKETRLSALPPLTALLLLVSFLIEAWLPTVAGMLLLHCHLIYSHLFIVDRPGCRSGLLSNFSEHFLLRGNWLCTNAPRWSSCMLTHTLSQPGYAIVSGGTTSRYTGHLSRTPPSLRSQDIFGVFRQLAALLSYRYTSLRSTFDSSACIPLKHCQLIVISSQLSYYQQLHGSLKLGGIHQHQPVVCSLLTRIHGIRGPESLCDHTQLCWIRTTVRTSALCQLTVGELGARTYEHVGGETFTWVLTDSQCGWYAAASSDSAITYRS